METGTKQLRVRGNIRHTGTTWIVGQASRLSPSSWHPFRGITKTSIPVWVQRESHETRTACARRQTCFRHPAGRSILTRTLRAPDFRPRKRLIKNECQPIPPYSGRGGYPVPERRRLWTADSKFPPCAVGPLTSAFGPPVPHSAFRVPRSSRAQSCPVVPGRTQFCHFSFFEI